MGACSLQAASPVPVFEIAGKFSGTTSNPQGGMALSTDLNLNLFGTTKSGGSASKGTIYKMSSSGGITTIINFTGANGQAPLSGLIRHSNGNFYGTMSGTSGFGTLFKLTQTGTLSKLVVMTGTDGASPGAQPAGTMMPANDGNLYGVTSAGGTSNQGTIYKLTTSGSYSVLKHFHGSPEGAAPAYQPVQGSDGNLYGTTSQGGADNLGTIYKISLSGSFATLAEFTAGSGQSPNSGLFQGRDGFFYGTSCNADATEGTVFKVAASGSMSVVYSFTSNVGEVPIGGVVQGNDGNFYGVTRQGGPSGNGTVYKVTPEGTMSTLYAFKGAFTGNAADGAYPSVPLTLASDGNIYGVTNFTLFRIRFGPKPISWNASPVSYSSATLYGSVNSNGRATTVYFEYAWEDPTLASGAVAKASPALSGTVNATASVDLKSLFPNSTYYYRLKAVNVSGTQYGVLKSFTTKPSFETTTAINIQADNATFQSTINPNGQPVKTFFRYGTDQKSVIASGSDTTLVQGSSIGHGFDDVIVQKKIGNLLPQTTYYYRAETVDPLYGKQTGNTHSFVTKVTGQFNGMVTNASSTGIYSGCISVNLASSQSMTGVLYFGGARYSLKGTFSSSGKFSQTISRGTLPSIQVSLALDPANHQITGTVTESSVTSQLIAGQLRYNSKVSTAPQAGMYTVVLPPNPLDTGTASPQYPPQGTGYLTMTVGLDGKVSASGKLGDGTAISTNGFLVSGSIFPLYAGLYGSNATHYRGSIYGNIVFNAPTSPTCSGTLAWYKEAQPNAALYAQSFETTTAAFGSLYIKPSTSGTSSNVLTSSTAPAPAQITFSDGNIATFSKNITIHPNNLITVDSPSSDLLSLGIAPNSGIVSGKFFDTGTGKWRRFSGVILQCQGSAAGYFIGTNQSGSFEIRKLPH